MKKSVMLVLGVILVISLVGVVSALLYNNVISEEKLASLNEVGISLVISPLWSAEFQKQDGSNLVISFLDVKQIKRSDLTTTWASNWYYLQDKDNQYLADASITYVNLSASTGVCSVYASDESCGISKILLNFNPETEYQSSTFAYDGFVSDISTRELIESSTPQFELNFNPQTGKLLNGFYDGESFELIDEAGIMSYKGFNLRGGSQ